MNWTLLPALALLAAVAVVACSQSTRWDGRDPVKSDLPVSTNPVFAKAGLIEINQVDSSIKIDLRYTRDSVIAKKPLYRADMPALLRPETAVRLRRANEYLKSRGYRLKVWDAYRPPAAQIVLWNASGQDDRFVANPYSKPSQHSCGTAVDVTLVNRAGVEVEMPTQFDSFTPQASAKYEHSDPEILERRKLLQRAMSEAGFYILPNEWWHFTDRRFEDYPQTVPLSAIESAF